MGPKRGTKAYKEEYTTTIYGINPRLKKLAIVHARRDRVLVGYNDAGDYVVHPIKPGWTAENEARLIFGLREVFSVPVTMAQSEYTKKKIEELREKAATWDDEAYLASLTQNES